MRVAPSPLVDESASYVKNCAPAALLERRRARASLEPAPPRPSPGWPAFKAGKRVAALSALRPRNGYRRADRRGAAPRGAHLSFPVDQSTGGIAGCASIRSTAQDAARCVRDLRAAPHATDRSRRDGSNLIVVPLVGVDAEGRRLGMGGGFYDRALEFRRRRRHWTGPRLVGLAFDCQRTDIRVRRSLGRAAWIRWRPNRDCNISREEVP